MEEGFDWVPFFEEMAATLMLYRRRQRDLVKILRMAGVNGLDDKDAARKAIPLTEMDPFTFTSLVSKQSAATRASIFASLKSQLNISAPAPTSFLGVPKADPRQAWLFPYKPGRGAGDVAKLWNAYEEVLQKKLTDRVFAAARDVPYVGKAKFTQAIFRASPKFFFPIDGQTTSYLARLGISSDFNTAEEYQEICREVRKMGLPPLNVQSHEAWSANQKKSLDPEANYQTKARKRAAKNSSQLVEPAGGLPLPPKSGPKVPTTGGFQRDSGVAAAALKAANFQCEINTAHPTFPSNVRKVAYVEAHHLVPFSKQENFAVSIDVKANLVALCPNCHKLLHHGTAAAKNAHLKMLFKSRENALLEKEIKLDWKTLLAYYKHDLIDEDA